MSSESRGPLLIALAAFFWATDALFRVPTVNALDPILIVTIEHVIGLALLTPWVLLKRRKELTAMKPGEWLAAALIGMGGSAFATVLFTAAFRYLNPSIVILLQKLQPVLVVLLAMIFLKERPGSGFFGWALAAMASAAILGFEQFPPKMSWDFFTQQLNPHSQGVIYAASAAAIWAASTVAGKFLLQKIPPSVATFWRFAFGLVTLLTLLMLTGGTIPWSTIFETKTLESLAYMGLVPGMLAVVCYYSGLEKTPASVATMVELVFPISAVALNALYLNAKLEPFQFVAGCLLLFSVTIISLKQRG